MGKRFGTLDQWLGYFETLHPKQIDFSLDRVNLVLERLEIAEPSYTVVTVGGTNGKGSCVTLLESIYLAAGYTVGAFTSPHLWRFNERIRSAGRDLDDAGLIDLFERIDSVLDSVTLSYFESSAVAAMLHFALAKVDVALLEVGMGGRLDAVNALDADAALIVSVDLDHMEWLGPDRDAIGFEKAGIARSGRPVIVADRNPPQRMLEEIERRGALLELIGSDFDCEAAGDGWSFVRADERARTFPLPRFGSALQMQNSAAVVAVVDSLAATLPVSDSALARGIADAAVRGRLETHCIDGKEWIFDVAHNAAAAAVLRAEIDASQPVARTIAVFGAMRDKQLDAVVGLFRNLVAEWHLAPVDSDRTAAPDAVATIIGPSSVPVRCHATIEEATLAASRSRADRILVFGSFYTVGPALATLGLYSAPLAAG